MLGYTDISSKVEKRIDALSKVERSDKEWFLN